MVVDAKERITTQVAVVTKRASVPPQRDSTKALCLNHFIVWHTQILKLQNCYEITGRFASTRFTGFRSQLNTSRGRQSLSILEEQSASKIFASHINSKWKKRKYGDIYIYIRTHTYITKVTTEHRSDQTHLTGNSNQAKKKNWLRCVRK